MKVSFSQWENYQQCPARWKFKSVMRLPTTPAGPAAQRGTDIHKTVEEYINGGQPTILHPAIGADYLEVFDKFRVWPNGDRWTERKLRLGRDFKWGHEADEYVIMVFDVVGFKDKVVEVGEWKSGKPKDTHKDQRSLYALGALQWWQAEKAVVTTYYLEDTEKPQRLTASATAVPKLIKIWDDRFTQMEKDKICAPRPGFYCRWCDFANSKGGPCQFS